MMAQLKNFQTGTGSDSFNGPVGSTTASTGAFTTLTASGNVTLGDASTDTLNVGNGGIVKDASGNVGLGTAAGNAKLSVETGSTYAAIFGTSSTSAGTTRISFGNYLSGAGGGAGSAAIGGVHNHGSSSLSSLAFYTHNGTSLGEVGRFDSAGNLGLGVTPQSWLSTSRVLQLGSGGAVEARSNYEPYLSITSNAYLNTAGTYKYIATAEAARYLQDAGTHKFFIAPSGSAGADITTFTQAMTLNASGNLGVGATSPSSGGGGGLTLGTTSAGKSFHVFSSSYASNGLGNFYGTDGNMKLQMGALSNTSAYIYANTGCDLVLYSGGSVSATLNAAGNLGLGVTPSAWSGYKVLQAGIASFAGGSSGAYLIQDNLYTDNSGSSWKYIANNYAAAQYYAAAGAHVWRTAPNNGGSQAGTTATLTTSMTLDASGRLGIGQTSPAYKLDIRNDVGASTSLNPTVINLYNNLDGGAGIEFLNGVGGKSKISFGVSSTGGGTDDTYIGFSTSVNASALVEAGRFDQSGNLLINQTSGADGKLNVTNGNGGTICTLNSGGTSPAYAIQFKNTNGTIGNITVSGTTTAYNTSSDYRLKNTIVPMTGALAKVALLKPCTYKWNADGSDGEGFIAHELAEVVPQCVTGSKDGVDAEGSPKYQGMDTSFLVATLTAAIQEQQALITAQQAALESLTTRLTALESK
jgi:hypothetical protein